MDLFGEPNQWMIQSLLGLTKFKPIKNLPGRDVEGLTEATQA